MNDDKDDPRRSDYGKVLQALLMAGYRDPDVSRMMKAAAQGKPERPAPQPLPDPQREK